MDRRKKKPSCFIIKREMEKNDGRQIAFFVGGNKGHNARQMMIFNAERQKAHRQASLPLQPHFEDEFLREWENGRFLFSKEQSVLLSACQTLVLPHPPQPTHPSSIRMIPWKLFCLSCHKFVHIKPFKADVCYLYEMRMVFSLIQVISAQFLFFFSSPESS